MPRNRGTALLISLLTLSLAAPTRAEVPAGVTAAAGAVFIVLHEKRKARIVTGCVTASADGISFTDDKNKHVYALWGPGNFKPGERLTLNGKRHGKLLDAGRVIKDLGVCQP